LAAIIDEPLGIKKRILNELRTSHDFKNYDTNEGEGSQKKPLSFDFGNIEMLQKSS